jgi:hypothetical protein
MNNRKRGAKIDIFENLVSLKFDVLQRKNSEFMERNLAPEEKHHNIMKKEDPNLILNWK